jgi:hypothetical protein
VIMKPEDCAVNGDISLIPAWLRVFAWPPS